MIRQQKTNNTDCSRLYIIPTPIGNLEDITLRALRILQEVDLICCEDTRVTKKLLNHYEIKNELFVFNDHSDEQTINHIITQVKNGKNVGLVSDAGMPGVADPGFKLIREAYNQDVVVEVLPGANAFVTSVVASNLEASSFAFFGFLNRQISKATNHLESFKQYNGIIGLYESPNRVASTLQLVLEVLGDVEVCICREITKMFEEYTWATCSELIDYLIDNQLKGEVVILINNKITNKVYSNDEVITLVYDLINQGYKKNDAIKEVVKITGLRKNNIYNLLLEEKDD